MAKNYEELDFTDDFMFGKVMEDKDLCKELLECLLGRPIGELEDVQTQREIRCKLEGKPIRLDVYSKDEEGIYDAEMQNLNHKSVESLELPRRSRFYQSMMDVDFLYKGNSYRRLPEGNVLFLCTFDPFGLDYPIYSFENRCIENPHLTLKDKTFKLFYNCTSTSEEVPEEVRELYRYIQTGNGNSELTRRIERAVSKARHNEEWRAEYMKELIHDDDVRTEGIEIGEKRGIGIGEQNRDKVLAANWVLKGKTISQIAEDLDRSEEYVRKLIGQ